MALNCFPKVEHLKLPDNRITGYQSLGMTLLVVFLVPKVIVIVEELHVVSVLVDVVQVGLGAVNSWDEKYV